MKTGVLVPNAPELVQGICGGSGALNIPRQSKYSKECFEKIHRVTISLCQTMPGSLIKILFSSNYNQICFLFLRISSKTQGQYGADSFKSKQGGNDVICF